MILALLLLAWHAPVDVEVCRATVFAHEGDCCAGGESPHLERMVRHTDRGIASRSLSYGQHALIVHGTRWAIAPKIDHGPCGQLTPRGRRVSCRRLLPDSAYLGCVDLTPPVAVELGAIRPSQWSGTVIVASWTVTWPPWIRATVGR